MYIEDISFSATDPDCAEKVGLAVDEHGCALVLGLYTETELAALQEWNLRFQEMVTRKHADHFKEGAVWAIKSVYELSPDAIGLTLTPTLTKLLLAASGGRTQHFHAGTLMGKTGEEEAPIEWHQDNGIPVDRDLEDEGSKGLREGGVPYRYGTDDVLDRSIECRVHIDPQRENGGCLHVFPGSHRWPVTDYDGVAERIADRASLACPAPAGSGLIFRPKLAHMSLPASAPLPDGESRCVLQLQFHEASVQLEKNLNWYRWKQNLRIDSDGVHVD
jgi:hypothetical protein